MTMSSTNAVQRFVTARQARRSFGMALWTALLLAAGAAPTLAQEYPIGAPHDMAGMSITAAYRAPLDVEPAGFIAAAAGADIQIEADIVAMGNNAFGLRKNERLPFLRVDYELLRSDGGAVASGVLKLMATSDGLRYGENVKLAGPGEYRLRYTVKPPLSSGTAGTADGAAGGAPGGVAIGRRVDRTTGVRPWFKPFSVEYAFTYVDMGRIGAARTP